MQSKIILYKDLNLINKKNQNRTIILATGVFDLFHKAHKKFLLNAKKIGDILIVGIESDQKIKKAKGKNRPIQNQDIRLKKIAKLPFVDFIFQIPPDFENENDYQKIIKNLKPDILALSSKSPFIEVKKKIMQKFGKNIQIVLEHDPSVSTTKIIKTRS